MNNIPIDILSSITSFFSYAEIVTYSDIPDLHKLYLSLKCDKLLERRYQYERKSTPLEIYKLFIGIDNLDEIYRKFTDGNGEFKYINTMYTDFIKLIKVSRTYCDPYLTRCMIETIYKTSMIELYPGKKIESTIVSNQLNLSKKIRIRTPVDQINHFSVYGSFLKILTEYPGSVIRRPQVSVESRRRIHTAKYKIAKKSRYSFTIVKKPKPPITISIESFAAYLCAVIQYHRTSMRYIIDNSLLADEKYMRRDFELHKNIMKYFPISMYTTDELYELMQVPIKRYGSMRFVYLSDNVELYKKFIQSDYYDYYELHNFSYDCGINIAKYLISDTFNKLPHDVYKYTPNMKQIMMYCASSYPKLFEARDDYTFEFVWCIIYTGDMELFSYIKGYDFLNQKLFDSQTIYLPDLHGYDIISYLVSIGIKPKLSLIEIGGLDVYRPINLSIKKSVWASYDDRIRPPIPESLYPYIEGDLISYSIQASDVNLFKKLMDDMKDEEFEIYAENMDKCSLEYATSYRDAVRRMR